MSQLTAKPTLAVLAVVVVVLLVAVGLFLAGRASVGDGTSFAQADPASASVSGADGADDATGSGPAATASPATTDSGSAGAVTVGTVAPRPKIPVTVTASPTTGLASGDVIDVRVDPDPGSQIYGVEARICAGDASVELLADFAPTQMGLCALHPLAPGATDYVNLPVSPPYERAEFSFTVGTGTDQFAVAPTLGGKPVSITCDAAHPCQLVVKLQVPDDVRFHSIPLTFA